MVLSAFTIVIALSILDIISERSVLIVFLGFPTIAILGGFLSSVSLDLNVTVV